MTSYLEQNNTSYQTKATAKLLELYKEFVDKGGDAALRYYQYFTTHAFSDPEWGIGKDGNSRGYLVDYGMGLGKSRVIAAVIAGCPKNRKPILLLPNSLKDNAKNTLKFIGEFKKGANRTDIEYPSLDAHNSASQIRKLGGLNNRLLLVDEAHNFFRSIINGSKNAMEIYNMIMNAHNLRIMFFTGTPISKNPFEMVPCINMLCGEERLPIDYETFTDLFVSETGVKNREILANRLIGLISFVDAKLPIEPSLPDKPAEKKNVRDYDWFPEKKPLIIHNIPMSTSQYKKYILARDKENGEEKSRGQNTRLIQRPLSIPKTSSSRSSTYYVKSRSICNFSPDNNKKSVYDLPDSEYNANNSPKCMKIIEIAENTVGPVLVYSQFIEHGLYTLSRYLNNAKYSDAKFDLSEKDVLKWTKKKRYAIISGGTPVADRELIRLICNSNENTEGQLIKILMISKSGAEGLDLRNFAASIQFEYYWDLSRNKQVEDRIVRQGSHNMLPIERREVQPHILVAVKNEEFREGLQEKNREEMTIDERLKMRSEKSYSVISDFNSLYREVSLECEAYGYGYCHVCAPTNAPLRYGLATQDIELANPCKKRETTTIKARVITLNKIKYYQKGSQYYSWSAILGVYSKVDDVQIINQLKML